MTGTGCLPAAPRQRCADAMALGRCAGPLCIVRYCGLNSRDTRASSVPFGSRIPGSSRTYSIRFSNSYRARLVQTSKGGTVRLESTLRSKAQSARTVELATIASVLHAADVMDKCTANSLASLVSALVGSTPVRGPSGRTYILTSRGKCCGQSGI
jgi:hypothetical protein